MLVFDDQPSATAKTANATTTAVAGTGLTEKDASKAATKKGEELIKKVIERDERDAKFKLL